jgi:predicted ATPase/class 3 adenylate cyclase
MVEFPSGTVTFLFTDLEGSTRLWEMHPHAMEDALARHDEILLSSIIDRGGQIVKATGDGFHAVFVDAARAVEAAVDAQRRLAAEVWGTTGELRVRIGVHSGAARLRGGDYPGPTVNKAARVMDAAHGGQVVVSQVTADLVRDELAPDVGLVDLGEHTLRDLFRPERLFQVTAGGIPFAFPRLRSVDHRPGNLPSMPSPLVGREEELVEISDALKDSRLVTLTGVGGIGKTRLALQVASGVEGQFVDGAWLCELAIAGDADTMTQVVATALGVVPRPGLILEASILEFGRERQMLIVLDNCEHLIDAAAHLADLLLGACPQVWVLATSREALGVDGEQIWPLASLSANDARGLFAVRAARARPDFALDDSNVGAVAEICRRLDGIPLAIELAAARVTAMSPSEVLVLLDERFRLLTGGRRTAVDRHQTLRAAVEWSYLLLGPVERIVFDRLGVFPTSFDAAAAVAVTSDNCVEGWEFHDVLTSLVNKSMVNPIPRGADPMRYQLNETMRQYARDRLDEAGDADRTRRAHAAYYAQFTDDYIGSLTASVEPARSMERFGLELDHLRAATTWALDSDTPGDEQFALRIAVDLAGSTPDVRHRIGLTAHAHRLLERAADPHLHAGILAGMANDALRDGDFQAAEILATRALDAGPVTPGAVTMTYLTLSVCAGIAGNHERQVELLEHGERAAAEVGANGAHDRAFFEMLLASATRGDPIVARTHATEAVRLAREAELPLRLAQTLNVMGQVLRYDDPSAAEDAVTEAARVAPDIVGASERARALITRAQLRSTAGDADATITLVKEALDVFAIGAPAWDLIGAAMAIIPVLARLRDLDAAVLAGATTDRTRSGSLLEDPRDRAELERIIEDLRFTFGIERYQAEAARGAAMSTEDLRSYLRDTTTRLTDRPDEQAAVSDRTTATNSPRPDTRTG